MIQEIDLIRAVGVPNWELAGGSGWGTGDDPYGIFFVDVYGDAPQGLTPDGLFCSRPEGGLLAWHYWTFGVPASDELPAGRYAYEANILDYCPAGSTVVSFEEKLFAPFPYPYPCNYVPAYDINSALEIFDHEAWRASWEYFGRRFLQFCVNYQEVSDFCTHATVHWLIDGPGIKWTVYFIDYAYIWRRYTVDVPVSGTIEIVPGIVNTIALGVLGALCLPATLGTRRNS